MKLFVIVILLIGVRAQAKGQELVWIVAPAIWNGTTPELDKGLKNLERYLEKSLDKPVKVELKTTPGFVLSQYLNLKKELITKQPDYIFYIESTRFFANDLEEILLSKNLPEQALVADKFSDLEISKAQPNWAKTLFPDTSFFMPIKKALFMDKRLREDWAPANVPNNEAELFLNTSVFAYEQLQHLLKDKKRLVFLFSAENLHYSQEIFSGTELKSSLAQIFFKGVNLESDFLKEFINYSVINFNTTFLPPGFKKLSRTEFLMAGSRQVLNSVGVQRSFQILKPIISSHMKAEEKTKSPAKTKR